MIPRKTIANVLMEACSSFLFQSESWRALIPGLVDTYRSAQVIHISGAARDLRQRMRTKSLKIESV